MLSMPSLCSVYHVLRCTFQNLFTCDFVNESLWRYFYSIAYSRNSRQSTKIGMAYSLTKLVILEIESPCGFDWMERSRHQLLLMEIVTSNITDSFLQDFEDFYPRFFNMKLT
jgi:hypothetical protein